MAISAVKHILQADYSLNINGEAFEVVSYNYRQLDYLCGCCPPMVCVCVCVFVFVTQTCVCVSMDIV